MNMVNLLQAKSTLSRLMDAIEQGKEREILIARNEELAQMFSGAATCPARSFLDTKLG